MENEKKIQRAVQIAALLYALTVLVSLIVNTWRKDYNALGMTLVACLTPLIVPFLFKLFKLKPVYEIELLSTVFTYFASLIGSGFHGYSLPFFDKILHFSSGILLTIAAMMLFFWIRKSDRFQTPSDWPLFLVFINAVNLAAAVLWEFYEYSMLIFFNNDCINHYTTGVHDSMTDMLCAFCAGLIVTMIVARHHQNGKTGFIERLVQKFIQKNGPKS